MNKPSLRILSNLARSGGTLVSRCIGSMDDIVLLSEIHPRGTHIFNPLQQAQDWYGMLRDPGPEQAHGFTDTIRLIAERCGQTGRKLVIRDWAHLDYIGIPFTDTPTFGSELAETLAGQFRIIEIALVRHPADVWLSTASLRIMSGRLGLEPFLSGFRRYAERAARSGFVRYEDFTADPQAKMQLLCEKLQLPFDPEFIHRWPQNTRVTGDVSGMSRGSGSGRITPLQHRKVSDHLQQLLDNNHDYRTAVELLGYPHRLSDTGIRT